MLFEEDSEAAAQLSSPHEVSVPWATRAIKLLTPERRLAPAFATSCAEVLIVLLVLLVDDVPSQSAPEQLAEALALQPPRKAMRVG